MADEQFDFEGLKELNFKAYKELYCKEPMLMKATAGIFLHRFTIKGRKNKAIFLPFKKPNVAKKTYLAIKKAGKNIHLLKHTALVNATYDKKNRLMSLEIIGGGLSPDLIKESGTVMFKKRFKLDLEVTGTSEDLAVDINNDGVIDIEDGDGNQDGVIDYSIIELVQEFQEAQELHKQSKALDKKAQKEALSKVSLMFNVLSPKVESFIDKTDQKSQLKTATRIKENIEKFQNALGGSSTAPEGANKKLDVLTGGISRKATQLLKDYQSQIAAFDKENDMGESLLSKLESISKIGKAKIA